MSQLTAEDKQASAKALVDKWLQGKGISITNFAKTMEYRYSWAWSLVRGTAPLTNEFIGRMLAAYGPEAAQLISDALNGGAIEPQSTTEL